MLRSIFTAMALFAMGTAYAQQALPPIESQDFRQFQNVESGIGVFVPTIGFHPLDQKPSADDHDFLDNATSTISLSFWLSRMPGSTDASINAVKQELVAGGRTVESESTDHNGKVLGWGAENISGLIKVISMAGCDYPAFLSLTYPHAERDLMEDYFAVIAQGFVLGPSATCPAR